MKALSKVLAVTMLIFVSQAVAQTCVQPPSGMVGWWPGDGTALDASGTNDGTMVSASYTSPGLIGDAFSFDGTAGQHVFIPDSPSLNPQHVTVEAWVRSPAPGPGSGNAYILAKGAHGCGYASFALLSQNNSVFFYVSQHNSSPPTVSSPTSGLGIWDGTWHHVAGTFDGAIVRLYVDGVEVGNGTQTGGMSISYNLNDNTDLFIGEYHGDCLIPFTGDVDELAMFNRALGPDEIQSIYDAGNAGKCNIDCPCGPNGDGNIATTTKSLPNTGQQNVKNCGIAWTHLRDSVGTYVSCPSTSPDLQFHRLVSCDDTGVGNSPVEVTFEYCCSP